MPMPGLTRSDQPWMRLGFPLRTAITTTELEAMPLVGPASQSDGTSPALTSRARSGADENATTSACWPAITARLWAPLGPYDAAKVTPLPAAVRPNTAPSWS
jgi:hypothetical protein